MRRKEACVGVGVGHCGSGLGTNMAAMGSSTQEGRKEAGILHTTVCACNTPHLTTPHIPEVLCIPANLIARLRATCDQCMHHGLSNLSLMISYDTRMCE